MILLQWVGKSIACLREKRASEFGQPRSVSGICGCAQQYNDRDLLVGSLNEESQFGLKLQSQIETMFRAGRTSERLPIPEWFKEDIT